jgi:predicted DNA-binding protein YlxM (UPF0122 family)
MLKKYLQNALDDLHQLISITEQDITDISEANHIPIFERIEQKDRLVQTFETKKKLIDQQINRAVQNNPSKQMEQILDDIERAYLTQLRESLLQLKEVNRRYARLVVSVGTFYSSLLEKIIPTEMDGYETVVKQSASFLEIKG